MNPLAISLLFAGWLLYWLIKANTERQANPVIFHPATFLESNLIEVMISVVCCLLIIAINTPPDVSTTAGRAHAVASGYASTSIIKNLLVFRNSKGNGQN